MPAYPTAECVRCDRPDAVEFMDEGHCQSCQAEVACLEAEKDVRFKGFIVADLRAAFEKVSDPADRRGPISCRVAGEAVMMTMTAIEYFTATVGNVGYAPAQNEALPFVITADGYRAGPAGDH